MENGMIGAKSALIPVATLAAVAASPVDGTWTCGVMEKSLMYPEMAPTPLPVLPTSAI
jgi:hypothetical protein